MLFIALIKIMIFGAGIFGLVVAQEYIEWPQRITLLLRNVLILSWIVAIGASAAFILPRFMDFSPEILQIATSAMTVWVLVTSLTFIILAVERFVCENDTDLLLSLTAGMMLPMFYTMSLGLSLTPEGNVLFTASDPLLTSLARIPASINLPGVLLVAVIFGNIVCWERYTFWLGKLREALNKPAW